MDRAKHHIIVEAFNDGAHADNVGDVRHNDAVLYEVVAERITVFLVPSVVR